jgi:hypothetical protein
MASALPQFVRDKFIYATAYLEGRWYALPRGPSDVYGLFVSKLTSLIALPLPLLSFLVVPFYGGSSTTVSLLVFVSQAQAMSSGALVERAIKSLCSDMMKFST